MTLPSTFDNIHMPLAREFINKTRMVFLCDCMERESVICDIGNQGKDIPDLTGYKLTTLDITGDSHPDIVADITKYNAHIQDRTFDGLMCTEVLEHVLDPFAAVAELHRIVKDNGYILITSPLNARIHGPIPDCWRFTEFGLKVLFRDFEIVYFDKLNTPGRNLFPLHYGLIVKKKVFGSQKSDPNTLQFSPVD